MIQQMQPVLNIDEGTFYSERDSRTNIALAQPPFPVRLAVSISPAWAETLDGQLALFWLSSLIARMGRRYNQLQICLPQGGDLIQSKLPGAAGVNLGESLSAHLIGADPFGSYTLVEQAQEGSFVVAIGDTTGEINGVVVRPIGWSAVIAPPCLLETTSFREALSNPIGAALAAALGAAEVYRHFNQDALGGREAQLPLWISASRNAVARSAEEATLWGDDAPLPATINIGNCMVVGGGALGGNALMILAALAERLRGRIDVVDHDLIDVSNLNRLIAALLEDVGVHKAALAATCFQGSSVEVFPHVTTYEKLYRTSPKRILPIEEYGLVLTGVDQMATRAFVQSDWPRFLIDAGTRNLTWRVSAHPVGPDAACAGCLAGKSQNSYRDLRSPLACAVGLPGQAMQAALPMDSYGFVSFFGATFMAARALQRVLGIDESSLKSFSTQALALNLAGLQHGAEPPSEHCLCRCSHPVTRSYRTEKYSRGAA
jgi:hypothetical protein